MNRIGKKITFWVAFTPQENLHWLNRENMKKVLVILLVMEVVGRQGLGRTESAFTCPFTILSNGTMVYDAENQTKKVSLQTLRQTVRMVASLHFAKIKLYWRTLWNWFKVVSVLGCGQWIWRPWWHYLVSAKEVHTRTTAFCW